MTNYDIENELRSNLSSGEKLIWTGKPKTGIMFRSSDIFLIPFSLAWGGFAIFWETTVLTGGAPFFFALFGIPFVLIALYITVGRFFVDAKKRANTIYGITSERVIIKTGIFSREIKSLNIHTLLDITLKQKSDNSGTIMLESSDFRHTMMNGIEWPGAKQIPQLEFIENVQNVYEKILQVQRQRQSF